MVNEKWPDLSAGWLQQFVDSLSERQCDELFDILKNHITDRLFDEKGKSLRWWYLSVKKNGKWWIYDPNNKYNVSKLEFDEISDYIDGFCKVRKGYNWGIFNLKTWKLIIEPEYGYNDFKYNNGKNWEDGWFNIVVNWVSKDYIYDENWKWHPTA